MPSLSCALWFSVVRGLRPARAAARRPGRRIIQRRPDPLSTAGSEILSQALPRSRRPARAPVDLARGCPEHRRRAERGHKQKRSPDVTEVAAHRWCPAVADTTCVRRPKGRPLRWLDSGGRDMLAGLRQDLASRLDRLESKILSQSLRGGGMSAAIAPRPCVDSECHVKKGRPQALSGYPLNLHLTDAPRAIQNLDIASVKERRTGRRLGVVVSGQVDQRVRVYRP
jgi:hypothetical protein